MKKAKPPVCMEDPGIRRVLTCSGTALERLQCRDCRPTEEQGGEGHRD